MGRMLGAFADREELDRPDLNKCPDCGCFFAGDNCPICGKECPENMRAGNRQSVKKKKTRRRSGSGRVTFVDWYHSWWFIVIMMFLFPLAGIILLITSPHEKWKKIVFVSIAAVYMVVSFFGIGNIISGVTGMFERPVDTSLTCDYYVAACAAVEPEELYRSPKVYEGEFIKVTLKVVERANYINDDYYGNNVYYICEAEGGSSYRIIIRDCIIDKAQNLIGGDVITVYGEGAGECVAYGSEYTPIDGALVNMAYVIRGQ
jgi:hypothetical protein